MTLGDWRLPTSKASLGGRGEAGPGQASPSAAQPTSEVGAIKAAITAPSSKGASESSGSLHQESLRPVGRRLQSGFQGSTR